MAELVAVLDTRPRLSVGDEPARAVWTTDSAVLGLRINDGPTITHADCTPYGKLSERQWQPPDELAFAVGAFYETIFHRRELPGGHIYDCHAFAAFVLRLSNNMTRPTVAKPLGYVLKPDVVQAFIMQAWAGYNLQRTEGEAKGGVHSFIALPRRLGIVPECLGVTGVGGNLVVAKTNTLPRVYSGQQFQRIIGANKTTSK